MKIEQFLWVEKYRPHTVAETILPARLKKQFAACVKNRSIPNMILSGPPGVGKTTVAKAMIEEIGCTHYTVNASLIGIDKLRNDIKEFSTAMSADGLRQYVILDEADKLSSAFQEALRGFIEEFSKITGFILTCNYASRIIEPLHSRCPIVDFKMTRDEVKECAKPLLASLQAVLSKENVPADPKVLVEVMKRYSRPTFDVRRILGELQAYANANEKIDSGILSNFTEERIKTLIPHLKARDFTAVRQWVTENGDLDLAHVYRKVYDTLLPLATPQTAPMLAIIVDDYQDKATRAMDQDINTAACLATIMAEVEWK